MLASQLLALVAGRLALVAARHAGHLQCAADEVVACPDCSTPVQGANPPCAGGPPACLVCDGTSTGGGTNAGGAPAKGGGQPGGNTGGGTTTCTDANVCGASLLGNIGSTTVGKLASSTAYTEATLNAGEDIYGPFEAGFGAQQDGILGGLGCSQGQGYVDGGIDTFTAEKMIAYECGVALPRWESGSYVSLLDQCGGHTRDYHFHERLSCLYEETGTHSTRVGVMADGKGLCGKWEDWRSGTLPLLDACGGHFGPTPDCDWCYHYHVQDAPPFVMGCLGQFAVTLVSPSPRCCLLPTRSVPPDLLISIRS